jgi:hypothetical protein
LAVPTAARGAKAARGAQGAQTAQTRELSSLRLGVTTATLALAGIGEQVPHDAHHDHSVSQSGAVLSPRGALGGAQQLALGVRFKMTGDTIEEVDDAKPVSAPPPLSEEPTPMPMPMNPPRYIDTANFDELEEDEDDDPMEAIARKRLRQVPLSSPSPRRDAGPHGVTIAPPSRHCRPRGVRRWRRGPSDAVAWC